MVERRTANGTEEVCILTGYSCPKAAKRWLKRLGITIQKRRWIVDKDLYRERVIAYNNSVKK